MTLAPELRRALEAVSTATLTTILVKKGLRRTWINAKPLTPGGARVVGEAFTLRFVPAREDLATPEAWSSPRSTRAAIEAMPAGCVVVIDARGEVGAGSFGDILCPLADEGARRRGPRHRRHRARRGRRDRAPAWRCGARARPRRPRSRRCTSRAGRRRSAAAASRVEPGDMIVADGDGAVAIPAKLARPRSRRSAPSRRSSRRGSRARSRRAPRCPGSTRPTPPTKARYEREKG